MTVSDFLEQCGVLRANTIDELFDVARVLDRCPLPYGNRVAINNAFAKNPTLADFSAP